MSFSILYVYINVYIRASKNDLVAFHHVRWELKGSAGEIPLPEQHLSHPARTSCSFAASRANFCECVTNSDKAIVSRLQISLSLCPPPLFFRVQNEPWGLNRASQSCVWPCSEGYLPSLREHAGGFCVCALNKRSRAALTDCQTQVK